MADLRLVLIGEEAAGVQTLRMLSGSQHKVVGVLASAKSTGTFSTSLWNVARALGYRTWPAELVKDPEFAGWVRSEGVDLILNVHSLYLIHSDILRAPRLGSFNVHPGPLPRYAGLNSVCWAIYHGEITHGVTVHEMVPEVDAGRIAYQVLFPISASETGLSLSAKCTKHGIDSLARLVEAASCGPDAIPRIPQDLSQRSYYGRKVPGQGWLSWGAPARDIINFVRACDFYPLHSPWGVPKTSIGGQELGISGVLPAGELCNEAPGTVRHSTRGVEVAATDEWVLIRRLLVDGRSIEPAAILKPDDRLETTPEAQRFECKAS